MPAILIHELVAHKIAKKYKKYDTNNFYLGNMIPDSVNAYGFASKEKRWNAHFRSADLNEWKKNIIDFYKRNDTKYENTYLAGYLIHVLTDIICDEIYIKQIYPDLLEKGFNPNSIYEYYRKELTKFENSNVNQEWWEEIKDRIQEADKIPINNIDEKLITDWIDCTIKNYENREYEDVEYITNDFLENVIVEMEKILKEIDIL